MANSKKLVFETTSEGCIVPISHALNPDGYFRKRVWVNGKLVHMMYHRYIWEAINGTIPDGYEIDHKCKNRACCNDAHLQMLSSTVHRTKDNTGRFSSRKQSAYEHWLHNKNSGTSLAGIFSVSVSAACKWIREWENV